MIDRFVEIINTINGFLWGPWFTVALVSVGIYFTIGTKFLPFRKFFYIMGQTIGKSVTSKEKTGEGTLTPLQAATSALASSVGVGSIVGVATSIASGGPGALFWMCLSAFFGMSTKYAEILLSIEFREKNEQGNYVGGPAFYMKKGLHSSFLAVFFTVAIALNCLGGSMVQSNSIASTVQEFVGVYPYITGIVLLVFVAAVCLKGIKALGQTAEKIVPIMALIYVGGGLIVILSNFTAIPSAIVSIFQGAFTTRSVLGGVGGYTIAEAVRFGIARGLYSNEAGLGSAPIAHATAITDHPARQGMWGVVEVFIVTFVICIISGLSILTSGVYQGGSDPDVWAAMAYGSVIPGFQYVVGLSLVLFAYTTIIAIEYYGESLVSTFIHPTLGKIYKYVFIPFVFIGSIGGLQFVWGMVDMFSCLQAIPNLIAIVILSPIVFKRTKEFFDSGKIDLEKTAK